MSGAIAWGAAPDGGLPSGAPYSAGSEDHSATATYGSAFFGFISAYSGPPVIVLHAFRATSDGGWVEQSPQTLDSAHPTGSMSADALGEHVFIPTIGGYKCAAPLYFDILPESEENPSLVFWWGEWAGFADWGPEPEPEPEPEPAPAPRLAWGTPTYYLIPEGPPYVPGGSGTAEYISNYLKYGLVGSMESGSAVFVGLDVRAWFYPANGGERKVYHADGGLGLDHGEGGTCKIMLYVDGRLISPVLVATVMFSEGYAGAAWYEEAVE